MKLIDWLTVHPEIKWRYGATENFLYVNIPDGAEDLARLRADDFTDFYMLYAGVTILFVSRARGGVLI